MNPEVSVVIPTKDRPTAVSAAVQSIVEGDWQDFEILVVDQSTDARTQTAMERFQDDSRVRYVRNERGAPGAASSRNLGVALSGGSIVAILDDDVTARHDWMRNIVAEFARDANLQFLCGKLSAPPDVPDSSFVPTFEADASTLSSWTMPLEVAGANFSMRRALFERVGGYEELWGPGSPLGVSDDVDIALRIVRSGAGWKVTPDVEVEHTHGRRTAEEGARLLRTYWYGNGAIYGRAARRGDIVAGLWFLQHLCRHLCFVVLPNVVRGRRPTRIGAIRDQLLGFALGLRLDPTSGRVSYDDLRGRVCSDHSDRIPDRAAAE